MNWDYVAVAAAAFAASAYLLHRYVSRALKKGGSGCSCGGKCCAGENFVPRENEK